MKLIYKDKYFTYFLPKNIPEFFIKDGYRLSEGYDICDSDGNSIRKISKKEINDHIKKIKKDFQETLI